MAEFEYNPLAESITLKWRCPNCGTEWYVDDDDEYINE